MIASRPPPLDLSVRTSNSTSATSTATEWAAAGTPHTGILLIVGIDHAEFGITLRVIEAALEAGPDQESWTGYAAWGTRSIGA